MSIDTIVTAISVIVAVAAFLWGVRSYQNQMNAQLFVEFTKRFDEIMQSFPEDAGLPELTSMIQSLRKAKN